jgi:hypothetical protein
MYMTPVICPQCSPHLAHMRELAVSGLKNILDCAEEMKLKTDALPDEIKPYGEAITKISMEVLIKSYVERLRLSSELGLRDIAQRHSRPNNRLNKRYLKRRSSDGI